MIGKDCTKCGIYKPLTDFGKNNRVKDGRRSECKVCTKKMRDDWKTRNPDYFKRWNEENPNYHKEYYESSNKVELAHRKRIWYKNNSEKDKEKCRRWREKNRNKVILNKHLRRQKINALPYKYTVEIWNKTLELFDHRCAYCGSKENIEQEHFIPVVKGGAYVKSNIIPACKSCNSSKKDRDFNKWYSQQAFYDENKQIKILEFVN